MDQTNIQDNIIASIDKLISSRIDAIQTTNSTVGVVSKDPVGFECEVKIKNEIFTCVIPEHLHSWIQKDDIVIIQDLYNNGQKRLITGKTGQLQDTPSLVFFNNKSKAISGVDGLFDNEGNKTRYLGTAVAEEKDK